MSRNLGTTDCYGPVVVEEAPRPITRAEAGPYAETSRLGEEWLALVEARDAKGDR